MVRYLFLYVNWLKKIEFGPYCLLTDQQKLKCSSAGHIRTSLSSILKNRVTQQMQLQPLWVLLSPLMIHKWK